MAVELPSSYKPSLSTGVYGSYIYIITEDDYKQDIDRRFQTITIEEKKEDLTKGVVNFIPFDEWSGGVHGRGGISLPIDCFVDLKLVNKICNSQYEFSYHCLDLLKKNYSSKSLSKIKHQDETLGYTMDALVLKRYFAECTEKFRHGFRNFFLLTCLPKYFCQCCHYSFNMDIQNDNICSKCLLYAFSKGKKNYDHVKGKNVEGKTDEQECNFYHLHSRDLQIIQQIFKAYRLKMHLFLKIKQKCIYINNGRKNSQGPGATVSDKTRLEFTKICFDLLESENTDQLYTISNNQYNNNQYNNQYNRNDYRFKGICKKWNAMKGFGFIWMDDGSRDLFVHKSDIRSGKRLYQGQNVEFSIVGQDNGRRKAINVEAGNQWNYKQN